MKKTAIVLFNLGGPDQLPAVKPFLFNLFNDRAIIDLPKIPRYLLAKLISNRRNKTACEIYENIGGKSPILEITNAQGEALEKELSFSGDFKVFVCMRYWHPMSSQIAKKIKEYGADEIIMLPLYPQFSTTTTGSSFQDFEKALNKENITAKVKKVGCYPRNQKFVESHARLIKLAIKQAILDGNKKYRLLFSAHGLPQKIIDKGDPYAFQVEQTVLAIMATIKQDSDFKRKKIDYNICYQSKVGPLKWTTPSLDDEISLAAIDKKGVIIIPIAFVSDHSETLVELDIEYKEMAQEQKVPFYYRVKALNDDGYFIQCLADICKNVAASAKFCSSDEGKRICSAQFSQCICR